MTKPVFKELATQNKCRPTSLHEYHNRTGAKYAAHCTHMLLPLRSYCIVTCLYIVRPQHVFGLQAFIIIIFTGTVHILYHRSEICLKW